MRTLLKEFNYKRRYPIFINRFKKSMKALGLISYLKDMELYDINEVNLDDMIMIRLKTNRKYI